MPKIIFCKWLWIMSNVMVVQDKPMWHYKTTKHSKKSRNNPLFNNGLYLKQANIKDIDNVDETCPIIVYDKKVKKIKTGTVWGTYDDPRNRKSGSILYH